MDDNFCGRTEMTVVSLVDIGAATVGISKFMLFASCIPICFAMTVVGLIDAISVPNGLPIASEVDCDFVDFCTIDNPDGIDGVMTVVGTLVELRMRTSSSVVAGFVPSI